MANVAARRTTRRPASVRDALARSRRLRGRLGITGTIALIVIAVYVVAAIFGPLLLTHSSNRVGAGTPFLRSTSRFWFGTDNLGRGELSRVIVATRVAILASVESVILAALVGTVIGVTAGYLRGIVDELLSRLMDLLFSVPAYLLGIVVIVVLGHGLQRAVLAIALVFIPQFGRIARAATIEVKQRAYVESARLAGRGPRWIIQRHVLPNITTPLSVMVGVTLANAEGAYAVLSYLGFGATPPEADYGSMLADSQQYMVSDPWLIFFPAAALVVLILGFVLLGDWIRDVLDPANRVPLIGAASSD